MFSKKVSKPILRHNRKPKPKRNDRVPGYIYVFYDRSANLCKIGLSRSPKKRRYYLSLEYSSELEIVAIVPILNMAWGERLLHENYQADRKYRHPDLNGYTEWFAMSSPLQRMELRIALWLAAIFVNGCYLIAAIVLIALIVYFVGM